MKAGFRGWLYRWISAGFGLFAALLSLSALEVSRLYGFPALAVPSAIGLGLSFLVLITALIREWSWKRYVIVILVSTTVVGLPYLALRPEMLRDDVLKQLVNPPLTVDLIFYRGIALRNDPERDLKIERLQFVYGFVNTYGANAQKSRASIPEAK